MIGRGPAWPAALRLMVAWQVLRLRSWLAAVLVLQLLIGAGAAVGLGYIAGAPRGGPEAARLVAGTPTLTLLSLGIALVPVNVAQARSQGLFELMWSLPVPRPIFVAADVVVWLCASLPGAALAVVVARARYGVPVHVSPLLVPSVLAVALLATALGYLIAAISPSLSLVNAMANFLLFCLFLFTPITFPSDRLPGWLSAIHDVLPFEAAGDLVRGTLLAQEHAPLGSAFALVGAWTAAAIAVAGWLLGRRV